jgi:glyoxylase-like metal-dependent hydrolase (beta-lactamase superfamily II)
VPVSAPQVTPLGRGLHRVTLPLPFPPSHVHCYALEDDEGWTLVDAGLGVAEARERWQAALAELGSPPVQRIVLTHFHPDHVGATAELAELTGAEVWQNADDEEQARLVFERGAPTVAYLVRHGVPEHSLDGGRLPAVAPLVHLPRRVHHIGEGDRFRAAGVTWRFVHLPGHADHQHGLLSEDDGRLICGDHLLDRISPTVGLYPGASEDPLGDYLAALQRAAGLGASIAYSGHGEAIEDVPAVSRSLDAHHARRLHEHRAFLENAGPSHAHAVSVALFGAREAEIERRLAVHETLAHLVRLELAGAVQRDEDGEAVLWEAA